MKCSDSGVAIGQCDLAPACWELATTRVQIDYRVLLNGVIFSIMFSIYIKCRVSSSCLKPISTLTIIFYFKKKAKYFKIKNVQFILFVYIYFIIAR